MKTKAIFKLCIPAFVLVALLACDKEDTPPAISGDEAAELVATSLAENSMGFAVVLDEAIAVTDEATASSSGGRTAACGFSNSYSFEASNPGGTVITYSYSYSYSYALTCGENDLPQSMSVEVMYSGEFDGPRMASAHNGEGELHVTKLDENSTTYLVNGGYSRSGSFQSKVRNMKEGNCSVDVTLDDLVVDKSSRTVLSGELSVTLTGSVTGKGSYNYSATIIFNGDGTANTTINKSVYKIDLATGTVTAE